jgi:hypothetical protein
MIKQFCSAAKRKTNGIPRGRFQCYPRMIFLLERAQILEKWLNSLPDRSNILLRRYRSVLYEPQTLALLLAWSQEVEKINTPIALERAKYLRMRFYQLLMKKSMMH